MCTLNGSPLCRLTPLPMVTAPGLVGDAPLVNKPVELVPSWQFWNRSNFTARLLVIPEVEPHTPDAYPNPPPEEPNAVSPAFWIVNVMPSELGLMNWKAKSEVT